MHPKLEKARDLVEDEPDEALRLCNEVMNDEFDSPNGQVALFMAGYLMMKAERNGLAYHIYCRCLQLRPNQAEIFVNMGMCLENSDKKTAVRLFDKALEIEKDNVSAKANKALLCMQMGDPHQCISLCNQILDKDPEMMAARHNRGLARLMLRDYGGWKDYRDTLGVKHRERRDYGLPDWEGEKDCKILLYGEQGVGDEVMFASCIDDLKKLGCSIVIDTDSRLESIFKRNFDCPVYGTRFETSSPVTIEHPDIDYQCAIGQLPYYFRKKEQDFSGTPYIFPDKERVKQWSVLLDKDKLRIGFAWHGGVKRTGEKERSTTIETFKPLLDLNAELVCLDYHKLNDEEQAFIKENGIKYWERAARKGCDLEDTLALVSCCDVVVTVCTTIVYFAGAQGIPCHVVVPDWPGYRYYIKGAKFPWYNSVRLYRGGFDKCMKEIKKNVKNIYRLRSQRSDSVSCAMP